MVRLFKEFAVQMAPKLFPQSADLTIDLHELGKLGKLVTAKEAAALV